jgi:hypothetical protein
VPAARDEAAERPVCRSLGIRVERLRVELAGEADDLLGGDLVRAVNRLVADVEISQ